MRLWLAVCLVLVTLPVRAVEPGTVNRFVSLSDAFNESIGRADLNSAPAPSKRQTASCMLDYFEGYGGAEAVDSLMQLMATLSADVQFDNPIIIAFNDAHSQAYRAALSKCLPPAS